MNRLHPRFGSAGVGAGTEGSSNALRLRAESLAGTGLAPLYENLADFRQVAESEEAHVAVLADEVAPAPVVRVPMLDDDVHDLDGLRLLAEHLFAPSG